MNALLTKHIEKEPDRTKEESLAEYQKAWESSKYLLRPLKRMLQERLQQLDTVRETDFQIPGHYGLLAFRAGRKEEIDLLLSMLPKSLED